MLMLKTRDVLTVSEGKKKSCKHNDHINQCSKNDHTSFEQALFLSYCLLTKISSSISTLVRQPLVVLDRTLSFKLSQYVAETSLKEEEASKPLLESDLGSIHPGLTAKYGSELHMLCPFCGQRQKADE